MASSVRVHVRMGVVVWVMLRGCGAARNVRARGLVWRVTWLAYARAKKSEQRMDSLALHII